MKNKLNEIINKIRIEYEINSDCLDLLEECNEDCLIEDSIDLSRFFCDYVNDNDELMLGHINLWAKVEDRDFIVEQLKKNGLIFGW